MHPKQVDLERHTMSRLSRELRKPSACIVTNSTGISEIPGCLKRQPINHDLPMESEAPAVKLIEEKKYHYVASKRLAFAMKGEKFGQAKRPKGTIYGVYETAAEAEEHLHREKLWLVAKVVCA